MRRARWVLGSVAVVVAGVTAWCAATRPSNDRDWVANEAVLPWSERAGDRVTVRNVRHTVYRSADDYTPAYSDRTYDLRRLERAWFVVEPFGGVRAVAHTFLSFQFAGDSVPEFVAISVEARKERGESYGAIAGLLRRFELLYVVADERDVVLLRTNVRRDAVYLYPLRADTARVRALFVAMLDRANALRERPQFYNTLTANCTSTIVRHVNALVPGRVPFSYRWLLPGYADALAFDLGLIDTALPFDSIRPHFLITPRAQAVGDVPDFSLRIRAR